jgi:thiamine biosynthesis protein ThiS
MTQTVVRRDTISVRVNGKNREIPTGSTIADLLASLQLDPRMVVVEHNRDIIRDSVRLSSRLVAAGDAIEIVHFVGGG